MGECLDGLGGYPTHAVCSAKHDGEIFAVFNLANARYAFNFGNPFSGTHFGAPRSAAFGLRLAVR